MIDREERDVMRHSVCYHLLMRKNSDFMLVIVVFCIAIALRVAYLSVTPFDLRGHDAWGHVEYIDYVLRDWSIPPPHDGFEFYQPPLYYFVGSAIVRAVQYVNPVLNKEIILQYFGLLLSIITLGIGFLSANLLFPKMQRMERLLFIAILGAFPSVVFFSARINNDTLYHFFAFLAFASLLIWWRDRIMKHWILVCVVIGLGLISKSNMILWMPIAFLTLCVAKNVSIRKKITFVLLLFVIPFALSGWFQIPRFFEEDKMRTVLVGNADIQTGEISSAPEYLLTFNPVQILKHPFNHIDGDGARRLYHWEYFFRSAFFGEFEFPPRFIPIAVTILISALLLSILALYRLAYDLRFLSSSQTAPVAITAVVLLLGAFAYRIAMPFSACQDFRFSIALALPWTVYMVMGIGTERHVLRFIHGFLCLTLVFSSAAFLLMIAAFAPS